MDKIKCPECGLEYPKHTKDCLIGQMHKKIRARPIDGTTWMVSIIHPDDDEGSINQSERGGKTAIEAAQGYYDDPDVRMNIPYNTRDLLLFTVVAPVVAASAKQWKVYIFTLDEHLEKMVPFP